MSASQLPSRRTVVLADREIEALDARELLVLAEVAADSHVVIVAPAGPLPGERWIIDLTARRTQALRRLEAWAAMLMPHARSLESEVGDENPRLALADARRARQPDAVVALEPAPALANARTPWLAELVRDRAKAIPARRTLLQASGSGAVRGSVRTPAPVPRRA